jgi:site-specific recombinase XerD
MFFAEFPLRAGVGRPRPVSDATSTRYSESLMHMVDQLRLLRCPLQNISELGPKHALRLIGHWGALGYSSATVQNRICVLRRFLSFIGKAQAVPRGHELVKWLKQNKVTTLVTRSKIATVSKSWADQGVDSKQVIERVRCANTAMQLELQAAFGLRVKESIQLNPQAADCETFLRVVHGTKGGLPRDVDFSEDPAMRAWQRDVLERAKVLSRRHPKGLVAIPGKRLVQSKAHFYFRVRQAGITKSELGVTAHGLRHQYASIRYQAIAHLPTPVSGQMPARLPADVAATDLEARSQVSRELGHFRPEITRAYVGSLPALERARSVRMRQWIADTEGNPKFRWAISHTQVCACWLGGRFAQGLEVDPQEPLRLIVQTTDRQPLAQEERMQLREQLRRLYSRPVDLSEHLDEGEPDGVLALDVQKFKTI